VVQPATAAASRGLATSVCEWLEAFDEIIFLVVSLVLTGCKTPDPFPEETKAMIDFNQDKITEGEYIKLLTWLTTFHNFSVPKQKQKQQKVSYMTSLEFAQAQITTIVVYVTDGKLTTEQAFNVSVA